MKKLSRMVAVALLSTGLLSGSTFGGIGSISQDDVVLENFPPFTQGRASSIGYLTCNEYNKLVCCFFDDQKQLIVAPITELAHNESAWSSEIKFDWAGNSHKITVPWRYEGITEAYAKSGASEIKIWGEGPAFLNNAWQATNKDDWWSADPVSVNATRAKLRFERPELDNPRTPYVLDFSLLGKKFILGDMCKQAHESQFCIQKSKGLFEGFPRPYGSLDFYFDYPIDPAQADTSVRLPYEADWLEGQTCVVELTQWQLKSAHNKACLFGFHYKDEFFAVKWENNGTQHSPACPASLVKCGVSTRKAALTTAIEDRVENFVSRCEKPVILSRVTPERARDLSLLNAMKVYERAHKGDEQARNYSGAAQPPIVGWSATSSTGKALEELRELLKKADSQTDGKLKAQAQDSVTTLFCKTIEQNPLALDLRDQAFLGFYKEAIKSFQSDIPQAQEELLELIRGLVNNDSTTQEGQDLVTPEAKAKVIEESPTEQVCKGTGSDQILNLGALEDSLNELDFNTRELKNTAPNLLAVKLIAQQLDLGLITDPKLLELIEKIKQAPELRFEEARRFTTELKILLDLNNLNGVD